MKDIRKEGLTDLSALKIEAGDRNNSGHKSKRYIIFWLIILIAAGAAGYGLLFKSKKTVVQVSLARVINQEKGIPMLNASGYVTPRRRATVAAKITGRVQEMLVEEGMHVENGQILARIDNSDALRRQQSAEAEIKVALASIADLKVNLDDSLKTLARIKKLHTTGVSSNEDLDHAQAVADSFKARFVLAEKQVKLAQARKDEADQDVENCIVRAPFSGVAVSKDAQVGEMVSPVSAGGGFTRTGIATIVDMNSLEIEVDVNEAYIAKVSIGQKVESTLDAYPEWYMPAAVRTIIPTADRQKATVKVRIAFDKLDPKILPDMGVKVTFLNSRKPSAGKNIILISQDAVQNVDNRQIVFIYKDGKLVKHEVKLGDMFDQDIEVIEGISAGEQVVVGGGARQFKDGESAEIKK